MTTLTSAIRSGVAVLFTGAIAVALIASSPGSVAHASGPQAAATPPAYCEMVVGKGSDPTAVSPTLFWYCSSSEQDALHHLIEAPIWRDSTAPNAHFTVDPSAINPYSKDLLMTWFQDIDYGGARTDIYGYSGTCDTAGYRIYPNSWWSTNLSSAAGFAQCNWADFTNNARNFAEGFELPVSYVGDTLNDNVGIVQVYHG